jgi:hypothetical protein
MRWVWLKRFRFDILNVPAQAELIHLIFGLCSVKWIGKPSQISIYPPFWSNMLINFHKNVVLWHGPREKASCNWSIMPL